MMSKSNENISVDGVVCFGGVDWWYHNRAHSDVQLMCHLSKRVPVLFVNSLGMRTPRPGVSTHPWKRIGRKLASMARGLRKVSPHMWVFSPLMLPPSSKEVFRWINARVIALQVDWVVKMLGFRNWVIWITVPTAAEVAAVLPRRKMIFNRSDAFSKFPEACEAYIRSCENRLLQNSDMVFYVNRKLMAEDNGSVRRKYYLGHGVDYHRFAEAAGNGRRIPAPLRQLKRPIVGFFGAIDDYTVDLKLLLKAVQALPEMSFVLIGMSTLDISFLTSQPNVHYLGYRPYAEIPQLGAGFDVGIMPWLQNEWIDYCNPVKLKEYLALGLPVVTTPIPQAQEYPNLLTVACGSAEFIAGIREAVVSNNDRLKGLRQGAVENDSWENKSHEVFDLIGEMTRGKVSGQEAS